MALKENSVTLKRSLSFDEVHWTRVTDLLVNRFKLDPRKAQSLVKKFVSQFRSSFNLYWFMHPELSAEFNQVVSAIGEFHGADRIEMGMEKHLHMGPLGFEYNHVIEFAPNFKQSEASKSPGTCAQKINLSIMGISVALTNARATLMFHLAVLAFGVFAYVILGFLMLYSASVFVVFLASPVTMTFAALTDGSIGLALICFLVGCAGIFGRAISNLATLAISHLRRQKRKERVGTPIKMPQ